MTEFALNWFRALWGREQLRRRVVRLERVMEASRRLFEQLKETNTSLLAQNHHYGQRIAEIETANREYITTIQMWEDRERRVDPTAKCPSCGSMEVGKLFTEVKRTGVSYEVRCVKTCPTCSFTFVPAAPVAGAECGGGIPAANA